MKTGLFLNVFKLVKLTLFTILFSFVFSENPYFSNSVLTKEYKLREGPDPESPLDYDGPEIIRHFILLLPSLN